MRPVVVRPVVGYTVLAGIISALIAARAGGTPAEMAVLVAVGWVLILGVGAFMRRYWRQRESEDPGTGDAPPGQA